jgi:hypothetical protein
VAAAAQVHNATVQVANDSCRMTGTGRFYSSEAQDIFGEGFFSQRVEMIQPVTLVSTSLFSLENVTTMLEAGFALQTGGASQFLRELTIADVDFRTVLSIKIRKTLIYPGPINYTASPTVVPTTTATPVPHVQPTTRPSHRHTPSPTMQPSRAPTSPNPSTVPSSSPSAVPSDAPSQTLSSHPTMVPATDEPSKSSQLVPTPMDSTADGLLDPASTSTKERNGADKRDPIWIAAMAGGSATILASCFLLCCMWCRRRDTDHRHKTKHRTVHDSRDGQSSQRTAYIVPDVVDLSGDHQSLANTSIGEQTAGRYYPKKHKRHREPNVKDIRHLKPVESFDDSSLYTTPYSIRPDDSPSYYRQLSKTRTPSSLSSHHRIGTLEFGDNILFPISTDSSSEGRHSADSSSVQGSFGLGGMVSVDLGKEHTSKTTGKNTMFSQRGINPASAKERVTSGSVSTSEAFSVENGPIDLDTEAPIYASKGKNTFSGPGINATSAKGRFASASVDEGLIGLDTHEPYVAKPSTRTILPLSSTTIRDSKKQSLGKPVYAYEGPIDLDTLKHYSSKNSKHPGAGLQESYSADSGTEVESQPDEERARQLSQALEDSPFDLNAHMDEWSTGLEDFDNDSHFSSDPPQLSYSSKSAIKNGSTAWSFSTRFAAPEEKSESSFGSMDEEEKCEVSDEHSDANKPLGTPSVTDRNEQDKRRSELSRWPTYIMDLTTNNNGFQRQMAEPSLPSKMHVSSLSSQAPRTRIFSVAPQPQNRNLVSPFKQNTTKPTKLPKSPNAEIHKDGGELEVTPSQQNHFIPLVTPEVKEENVEDEASDLESASDVESDGSGVFGMQARDDGSNSPASSDVCPWLFDTLEKTLGPRSVTADLESLSGSKSKSRSRTAGGAESVASGVGSRISYGSSAGRRSKSLSPRTLEHELKRLELQLAAVLDSDQTTTSSVTVPSISGNSLTSTIYSRNRAPKTIGKKRFVVDVPPGKLGVILANRHDGKGTIIMEVRENSSLKGRLSPGDKLMAVDGQDVTDMVVSQITSLMASKTGQERRLTFISSETNDQGDFSESKTDVGNH